MITGVVLKDQVQSIQTVLFSQQFSCCPGGTFLHQGHDLQGGGLEPTNLLLQGSGSFDAAG